MAQYYKRRPSATTTDVSQDATSMPSLSEFDKYHVSLLTDDTEEGWTSELQRYLSTMQRDVTKKTDLIEWWQVGYF